MKFLIFGGNGFLGSYLKKNLKKNYTVASVSRIKKNGIYLKSYTQINISKIISKINPDVIINTIALTNVDKCQTSKKIAYRSNVIILKLITQSINQLNNKIKRPFLIHLSTDQVYSGKGPHSEFSVKPINYYSKTKLLSEKYVDFKNGCVLRTNFLGYSKKHENLNNWIVKSVKKKKKIYGYKNIYFSPLSMHTLAKKIIIISRKQIGGIFNLGSLGGISKGRYIKLFLKKKFGNYKNFEMINFTHNKNKKLIAKRPLDMRMNNKKIIQTYKFKLPKTIDEVEKIIKNF